MKIIVIGGTGLIGSRTIAVLHQGGHELVAASRRSALVKPVCPSSIHRSRTREQS